VTESKALTDTDLKDPPRALVTPDDDDTPLAVAERRRADHNRHRVAIRVSALLTPGYVFMNAMAAIIASYGLLGDSPAVVIGAMIVALLLGPIMGVALALTDGDWALFRRSFLALAAGGVVVFAIALAVGFTHDLVPITDEIRARTAPNIFDLMIALAGGAAGAYATVSPRIATGFVGVAIATALVPPLASSALLLTRGEYSSSSGAALLAFTNVVAIQFAAAVVLWVRGYARDNDGDEVTTLQFLGRHLGSIAVLVGLGLLLAANLRTTLADRLYEGRVRYSLSQAMAALEGNQLYSMQMFVEDNRQVIRAELHGPVQPTVEQVVTMRDLIPPPPEGRSVDLRVRHVETRIITPDGYSLDPVDPPLSGPPVGEP